MLALPTVVSLRQMQRKAAREKERNQELRRLHDEAQKEEGLRLTQRLQELEKDKNIMLVGELHQAPQIGPLGDRALQRREVAWARRPSTLSFPGHLAAGGSPLPLQAEETVGSASLPDG